MAKELKNTKKTEKTVDKQKNKGDHLFKAGDPRINRNGRPLGTKNFITDFRQAVKTLADEESGEPLTEMHIIRKGIKTIMKGDARFDSLFKDFLDRVYGKPTQSTDITSGGDKIVFLPNEVLANIENGATPETKGLHKEQE